LLHTSGLATVGTNLSVGTFANVGSNLSVGTFADITNNLVVGTAATVGTTLNVAGNTTVGNLNTANAVTTRLLHTSGLATVGTNLSVGTFTNVGSNLSVGTAAIVGTNLSVGTFANITNNLAVGTAATVGTTLNVTGNTTVGNLNTANAVTTGILVATNRADIGQLSAGATTLASGEITGSLVVGGNFTIQGQTLLDTDTIKLRSTTKQTIGAGVGTGFVINRANSIATLNGTSDFITSNGHGLLDGQNVSFISLSTGVTGLSNNTIYRVVQKTDNAFRVASVGAFPTAIDFSTIGLASATLRDMDNPDGQIRWNEVDRYWDLRDVRNSVDATAYSKILTANLISNSLSSTSADTVLSSQGANTLDVRIVTANTNLRNYTDNLVSTANTNLRNYTDNLVSTANTNLKNYVDVANTSMKSYVDTANTNLRNYTDNLVSTANTNLKNYSDSTFVRLSPVSAQTISQDLTLSGNVIISQNLTISGTVTTVNTQELNIADNEIVLNSDVPNNIAPTQNAGFIVNRGSSTNTYIRWNETIDSWVANNGISSGEFRLANTTTHLTEGTNLYLTADRVRANVSNTAPILYNSITGVFSHATSGVTAATHGNNISVPVFVVNAEGHVTSVTNTVIRTASTTQTGVVQLEDSVTSTSTSNAAVPNSVRTAQNHAAAAFNTANSATTTAQAGFNHANAAFGVANSATTTAQASFNTANSATTTAQAGFNTANSATTTAQAAFNNSNTKISSVTITNGTGISGGGTGNTFTLSIGQDVATTSNTQFASVGVGTAADSANTGSIVATGDITAYYSDDRLKTKLGNIENALSKVEQLSGFYYQANEIAQELGYNAKREVGVSAQEVQKVMPEVIAPAPIDEQYLTVKYERMVPLLIEAIKELKQQVDDIKNQLNNR
jgi:hypothetical protein